MEKTLIQSYVYYKDQIFFVSTINRRSSALAASDMIYAETLVWECDPETKERGDLVNLAQTEDVKDGLKLHFDICTELFLSGKINTFMDL